MIDAGAPHFPRMPEAMPSSRQMRARPNEVSACRPPESVPIGAITPKPVPRPRIASLAKQFDVPASTAFAAVEVIVVIKKGKRSGAVLLGNKNKRCKTAFTRFPLSLPFPVLG
jgi:hypothetical protein